MKANEKYLILSLEPSWKVKGKGAKNEDEKINFILLKNIGTTTQPNKNKISIKNLKQNVKKITQY